MHQKAEVPPEKQDPALPVDRRRFLAATVGGVIGLLLQACGREEVVPTPGTTPSTLPPSPTTTPTASVTPGATASPTALDGHTQHLPIASAPEPSPTATTSPTETATATPPPTATPRPQPTPFPPGPATKLGLFIGYQHPKFLEILESGNLPFVKTLEYDPNLMEHIKKVSPQTILVARYTPLGQLDWETADPAAEARRFVDLLLPIATEPKRLANIDAWEAYNEPVVKSPKAMQNLATFEAERTRMLAAAGIRSCVGNFGTGDPELDLWPHFFPAVRAVKEHGGYLGLHEYSAPYMWFGSGPYQLDAGQDEGDEGWLTLRYRKVYRDYLQPNGLEVPLLITETGIDGQVLNRPGPAGLGWRDFASFWESEGRVRTTAAGFYVEQLAWYDAELSQDPYVKGASIFALAGPRGWETFELLGQCADILHQYIAVHPRR